jgi:hypothetical protein
VALHNIAGPALPGASTLTVVTRNLVASLAVAALTTILQTQIIVHDVNLSAHVSLSTLAPSALYYRLVAAFIRDIDPSEARIVLRGAAPQVLPPFPAPLQRRTIKGRSNSVSRSTRARWSPAWTSAVLTPLRRIRRCGGSMPLARYGRPASRPRRWGG